MRIWAIKTGAGRPSDVPARMKRLAGQMMTEGRFGRQMLWPQAGTGRHLRRALLLLLTLALLLISGCGALFDETYYETALYEAPAAQEDPSDAAYDSIANYTALRRAIARMVSEHVESAQLQFTNYDGSIRQDISTACWEVKSSTALGAFAVDYISYDLSRIVSYYQAEVYITYKRTAAQTAALENIGTASALAERLDRALRAGETYLVLEIAAAPATADTVRDYVLDTWYADPLACPVLPEVEAGLYPESGVSRIAEITLNYGLEPQALAQRRQAVDEALAAMTAAVLPDPEEEQAPMDTAGQIEALCQYLADNCRTDSEAGSTVWDALVNGAADSQGVGMALLAGCQAAGIDCRIVYGRLDGEPHFWNIVTVDGAWYHVDVTAWTGEGGNTLFLAGDEQLWGTYWWDTSQYPACPESYAETLANQAASNEPSGEMADI